MISLGALAATFRVTERANEPFTVVPSQEVPKEEDFHSYYLKVGVVFTASSVWNPSISLSHVEI